MANWTRDQLLAALNLYHSTPFGQQHKSHPPIIKLGGLIGRTPDAVAMKLSNFTSLDPIETARGIKGLSGASNNDREIWAEFEGRANALAEESEAALEKFSKESGRTEKWIDARPVEGPSERIATVKVRRQQAFFRRSVLGSYGARCCITGNPVPTLLRASHIVPWAKREKERANPSNGLCLAATFDAAFDGGLIALDDKFRVLLSDKLMSFLPNRELERSFGLIEGNPIKMPEKNLPDPKLLAWHREHVFLV
jgi:hypothetical protein